jgi:hypothetical protein
MRPWVKPFPADSQHFREVSAAIRKQLGVTDAGRQDPRHDDDPQLWWDLRAYHRYLLEEARLRGYDYHEGVALGDLELLALLQHHGAATHLLDVSRDAITALWFASCEHRQDTGVVIGFDDTGFRSLTAQEAATAEFVDLMPEIQYKEPKPVVGLVPRNLTPRILAQRGLFIVSGYADQPWGSVEITSTYAWQHDVDSGMANPRAFFIAVTPGLKQEVYEAGISGLLGVDPLSLFPDIAGFATENRCSRDVPLLP